MDEFNNLIYYLVMSYLLCGFISFGGFLRMQFKGKLSRYWRFEYALMFFFGFLAIFAFVIMFSIKSIDKIICIADNIFDYIDNKTSSIVNKIISFLNKDIFR